jgi:hypothetical protein
VPGGLTGSKTADGITQALLQPGEGVNVVHRRIKSHHSPRHQPGRRPSKCASHRRHEITLAPWVDWPERALMDGELADGDAKTISSVIARLGAADVCAFGLAWKACESLLSKPGFAPRIEVVSA